MNNHTDSQIFNMATQVWTAIHDNTQRALDINDEYITAMEEFNTLLDSIEIDKKMKIRIEDCITAIFVPVVEEGYSKGFADAVKLMTACYTAK